MAKAAFSRLEMSQALSTFWPVRVPSVKLFRDAGARSTLFSLNASFYGAGALAELGVYLGFQNLDDLDDSESLKGLPS
jgi:hypothetical protein